MRFKVDENLPEDVATVLQDAGHDARTVGQQDMRGSSDENLAMVCVHEDRVLVTLDLDFADVRLFETGVVPAIVVLRLARQDRDYVVGTVQRLVPLLEAEHLAASLWIVDEHRVRIRPFRDSE